jgi:hypothetical protein
MLPATLLTPHAWWKIGAKRLNSFEIALAQRHQPQVAFDQVRDRDPRQGGPAPIQLLHLSGFPAVADQGEARA